MTPSIRTLLGIAAVLSAIPIAGEVAAIHRDGYWSATGIGALVATPDSNSTPATAPYHSTPTSIPAPVPPDSSFTSEFAHFITLTRINAHELGNSWYTTTFDPITETMYVMTQADKSVMAIQRDGTKRIVTRLEADPEQTFNITLGSDRQSLFAWERSLGPLYEIDLSTGVATRRDESRFNMTMSGHAATMDANGVIHAIGGYGYWQFWNRLLFFDSESREWQPVRESSEDRENGPYPFANGKLVHLADRGELLLLGFIPHKEYRLVQVATYSIAKKRWTRHGLHRLDSSQYVISVYLNPSNHGLDAKRGLLHFASNVFYDLNREAFYVAENESKKAQDDIIHPFWETYFSAKRNGWVRIARVKAVQPGFFYGSYEPLQLTRVSRRVLFTPWFEDARGERHYLLNPTRWMIWVNVVLVCMLGVTGVYVARVFSAVRREESITDQGLKQRNLHIRIMEGAPSGGTTAGLRVSARQAVMDATRPGVIKNQITATAGTLPLLVEDPALGQLLRVLHEMKRDERNTIPLHELDAKLANSFPSQSAMKNRNRLIAHLNRVAGGDLVTVQRSAFDRRFKELRVELSRLNII